MLFKIRTIFYPKKWTDNICIIFDYLRTFIFQCILFDLYFVHTIINSDVPTYPNLYFNVFLLIICVIYNNILIKDKYG